jgi:hypothetical protein
VVQPLVPPQSPVLPSSSLPLSPFASMIKSSGGKRWEDIDGQKWVITCSIKDAISGKYCGHDPFIPSLTWIINGSASPVAGNTDGVMNVQLTLTPREEDTWREGTLRVLEVITLLHLSSLLSHHMDHGGGDGAI